MPSIRDLAPDFSRQVRDRGEDYFREGRVSLVRGTNHSAYARVRGSTTYVVDVQWDKEGIVEASCTCPYYEGHLDLCKHIWATLLEAESVGHLVGSPRKGKAGDRTPEWKWQIEQVRRRMEEESRHADRTAAPPAKWGEDRQVNYILDVPATLLNGSAGLVVELATQRRLKDGTWDRPKRTRHTLEDWLAVPDEADRQAVQMLVGARSQWEYSSSYQTERAFVLPGGMAGDTTLRTICRTGRCKVRTREGEEQPPTVEWDEGPAWEFRMRVTPADEGKLGVSGYFARAGEEMGLGEPSVVLRVGVMVARGRVSRLDHKGAFDLLAMLREGRGISVPRKEAGALVEELYRLPSPPAMELPEELRVEEVRPAPRPVLKVKADTGKSAYQVNRLLADLTYEYEGRSVIPGEKGAVIFDAENKRMIRRDHQAEAGAWQRLMQAGFRLEWIPKAQRQGLAVQTAKFAKAVRGLVADGWHVEAEGKLWRSPTGKPSVSVTSGIDWFELDAKLDYSGTGASLPRLLEALRKGQETVVLDDGSVGIVPEEWLKKYAPLAGFGEEKDGKIRFAATQVGFLDALLANAPDATWDEAYETARRRLREFSGVRAEEASKGFVGELRPYQKEGLGWLRFLRDFGFGGCLADDMGLGKTVVVLSMLAGRKGKGPSLVVAPRSLMFNWAEEAKRFAPNLRVLDHSPAGRTRATEACEGYDLILTTYGTLRRDAGYLKDVQFDYVVLDESQAIKNASTASAKACKLLKANHRLALSGTPIENHLGELWSLLDFLNPGMLGTATAFRHWAGGTSVVDIEARETLAQAIRPFVLRRTKRQVAKDLPERTEQTIWCELDTHQRKLYDELRDHYRASLLERVKREGINKAKIQILEALLRLRQAACHPGLIDPKRAGDPSSKFEALFADLDELMEEGHKVLVFSQFTSLLALVKKELDSRKVAYEYLDGKTKDRQARVDRFQSDPTLKLFLISLKAGGVGLNLTAADYVFLLDPWWNPAAEAQAVDRAHRIGQIRNVFAYRLIAKDTVEEKVLELQQSKRDLAEAIITADNALIAKLGREDLERLLS